MRSVWTAMPRYSRINDLLLLALVGATVVYVFSRKQYTKHFINGIITTAVLCAYLFIYYFYDEYKAESFPKMVLRICTICLLCFALREEHKQKLYEVMEQIIIVISIVSLSFWLVGSILGIIQPSGVEYTIWSSTDGSEVPINTYYHLYFETQYQRFFDTMFVRNSAIFTEAPMSSFMFCFAFLVELFKKKQYKERVNSIGSLNDMFLFNGIPMIRESKANEKTCGNAYTEIFGTGYSFESIFELGISMGSYTNEYVSNFYGNSSNTIGRFAAPEDYYQNVTSGNNEYFAKNDCRVYENIISDGGKFGITKYVNSKITLENDNITDIKSVRIDPTRSRSSSFRNWIFYRLSDVMLIKAEALIMKDNPDFQVAFSLINSINKRARNYTETVKSDSLAFSTYSSSREEMEKLLFMERKREFMFEGKRWFDLVRKSLRDNSTRYLANEATQKQKENAVAIKIQLADINAIFWPYNRDELKRNNKLKQNSAYSDTEDFQK